MDAIQIPDLAPVSSLSTFAFVAIVAAIGITFVVAVRTTALRCQRDENIARLHTLFATVLTIAYAGFTAGAAYSGILERGDPIPNALPFMFICILLLVMVAFSSLGTRMVHNLPITAIVAFQGFRLPLELILHRWYLEGVVPVQMTFEGHNFDIFSGIVALILAFAVGKGIAGWKSILAYNIVGTILLMVVTSIALLSSPLPIRSYENEPVLVLVFNAPYIWILSFCVAGALGGHILVFRWLFWSRRQSPAT